MDISTLLILFDWVQVIVLVLTFIALLVGMNDDYPHNEKHTRIPVTLIVYMCTSNLMLWVFQQSFVEVMPVTPILVVVILSVLSIYQHSRSH